MKQAFLIRFKIKRTEQFSWVPFQIPNCSRIRSRKRRRTEADSLGGKKVEKQSRKRESWETCALKCDKFGNSGTRQLLYFVGDVGRGLAAKSSLEMVISL